MLTVRPPTGQCTQRAGLFAKSKWTNTNRFDPFELEMDRVFWKYDLFSRSGNLLVKKGPTHHRFVMPVSAADIREELARVPQKFLGGLKAVMLLGGSRKQEKTFDSLFCYGCYYENVVFLSAYPKSRMRRSFKTLPKPSWLAEFERAGARVERAEDGCDVVFDDASLKTFYLREVLMHELGHHVDRENIPGKSQRRAEGFADWFAAEYGYRLRR